MRNHFTLLLVLSLSACGGTDVDERTGDLTQPLAGRCADLEGVRFETVDTQQDCGPAPAGSAITCRWRLSFAANDASSSAYVYHYSDVGSSGRATCTDGVVLADDPFGHTGSYDATTGILEWDGIVYRRVP